MKRLSGLMALAALFLAAAAPAPDGGELRIVVMGVVAPSSTFGLNKHLLGIPGVRDVHFDLLHGIAAMHIAPGAVISDEQLRAAVRSASYTPGEIRRIPPATMGN